LGAAELGADGLNDGGEGDVAVPAQPGTAFEVVQAEAVYSARVSNYGPTFASANWSTNCTA